jgi:signal transduction histidine kinase
MGNEARLRQILISLLSNAVKFIKHGGVILHLDVKTNTYHHLLIDVEDSGPEHQQRLFQPFVQFDRSTAYRYRIRQRAGQTDRSFRLSAISGARY